MIEIRIGSSGDLLQSFDRRELDTVIVRLHAGRRDAEVLTEEKFGWFAEAGWEPRAGEPLPVATLAEPCGVRVMAGQMLDEAGVPWTEIFVGGGVAAVVAAVMAGLGVAALAPRMVPFGAVDVDPRLRLPDLPRLPALLHSRVKNGRPLAALAALSAAYRSIAVRSWATAATGSVAQRQRHAIGDERRRIGECKQVARHHNRPLPATGLAFDSRQRGQALGCEHVPGKQ